MSTWKQRLFGGPADGESCEELVRRLNRSRLKRAGTPLLPPMVELYDRIAALEDRVRMLESG